MSKVATAVLTLANKTTNTSILSTQFHSVPVGSKVSFTHRSKQTSFYCNLKYHNSQLEVEELTSRYLLTSNGHVRSARKDHLDASDNGELQQMF